MSLDSVDVDIDTYEVKFTTDDIDPTQYYAQVIFLNVAENYPSDAHVQCRYEIRPTIQASTSDWVGLFKVGWGSVREYRYFHWVKLPSDYQGGRQLNCEVLFQSHSLPKDDGEYYQFCYVTGEGQVRGASTPFQFRVAGSEEFVTVEDDESDILFVCSKTAALESRLEKTLGEYQKIEAASVELAAQKETIDGKLQNMNDELDGEKDKNDNLSKEKQDLFDKLAAMESVIKDMTQSQETIQDKVQFITKEKEEILKRLEENEVYIKALQGKIKNLLSEKDSLTGKQKSLEEERELYKTHFTSSEHTIQGYLREISDVKKSLHDESVHRAKLEQKLPQIEAELEKEKKGVCTQSSYTKAAMEKLQAVTEKLKNCEDKLMAVEHCKMMLNEEVIAVHDAHDKMAASLEKALSESHTLKGQIVHLEEDNEKNAETLRHEIKTLTKQNANMQEKLDELRQKVKNENRPDSLERSDSTEEDGAHYALKLAQAHLEKTLAKYKRKYDELKAQIDATKIHQRSQQTTEKELRDEIQDLKERLAMGAEEYKMKFIECKRLQKELRKIKKQTGDDCTPPTPERDIPQTSSPSKTRRESYTQVDNEDLGPGDEAAWQRHLDTYKRLLEARSANLYKQELSVQRNENDEMINRHRDELTKYRSLAADQEELMTKLERESNTRCRVLKGIIEQQRGEIERLDESRKSTVDDKESEKDGGNKNPWISSAASYPTLDLARIRRHKPFLLHTNVYPKLPRESWVELAQNHSAEGAAVAGVPARPKWPAKRLSGRTSKSPERKPKLERKKSSDTLKDSSSSDSGSIDKPIRLIERIAPNQSQTSPDASQSASPKRLLTRCTVTHDRSVMDSEAETTNDKPLRPLPPPLEPVVLPSAKMAAIKATAPPEPKSESESESGMGTIFDRLDQMEIAANNESEHEEERFLDANGDPQKICPVCCTSFPSDIAQFQFEDHVESHYGPVCPMCYRQFPDDCPVKVYEEHVQSHFLNLE